VAGLAREVWSKPITISIAFKGFLNENLPKRLAEQPLEQDVAKLLGVCIR
jgi:hypothetical protein